MAKLFVVYWRDIPAQVIVKVGHQSAKRRVGPSECGEDLEAEATQAAERLEREYDEERLTGLVSAGGLAQ